MSHHFKTFNVIKYTDGSQVENVAVYLFSHMAEDDCWPTAVGKCIPPNSHWLIHMHRLYIGWVFVSWGEPIFMITCVN